MVGAEIIASLVCYQHGSRTSQSLWFLSLLGYISVLDGS